MRKSKRVVLYAVLSGVSLATPAATVSVISLTSDQAIEAPRWMYDANAKVKGGALINHMVAAKKALLAKKRTECVESIIKAYPLGKSLGPWLSYNHLQCALLKDKAGKLSPQILRQALQRIDAQPNWLLFGPSVSVLRSSYTAALLGLAEHQSKSDRRAAWKTIDKLQQVKSWLTPEERASTYRYAGELAFIEQNLATAQDFLMRSLNERESADIRARVDSIRSTLLGKKMEAETAETVTRPSADLGVSDDEREIFTRMNRAFDNQDYISAIEDGIALLQEYPGSRRSLEASERILDIYLSLATKTEDKFRNIRQSVVKEMAKADAARMARWANNAYAKGNYLDALTLGEKSFVKYAGHPDSTKILLLVAKAALAAGEYSTAENHLEKILKEHSGTNEALEAAFRLGLLQFRQKNYSQASGYFERVLALGPESDFEYRAMYWRWRAQQKIDKEKATSFAKPLTEKYPLTYYGLRAQAEMNGGEISLPTKIASVIKVDMRLLESERLAWERLQVLLKAGWFKEAERELAFLPDPHSNEERLIRARFWAAAIRQDRAIELVNAAIEDNSALAHLSVVKIIFPLEYAQFVRRESKSTSIAPEWIWALMRQESSFRPDVKSSSNAMGLMQLLPSTAAEIARDLKLRDFQAPESLMDPEINVRLGSVYLARLLRNFNANMPLALAAYNAGPARLKRWLSARKGLNPAEMAATSSPEVEVWIDELPWEETSFYVKSILRNWMIYQLLDGSKLSLSEPIWVDVKAASR